MEPKRPQRVSPYAAACLDALSAAGLGRNLSLGGAFGLAHYVEYRDTHDVDAWWASEATEEDRRAVVAAIERALAAFGAVRTRRWGDVVAVDLDREGKTAFGFQIARRSALLRDPLPSPWAGISVDALDDLVAAKMVALVERGAPRDVRDVFTLCDRGLSTVRTCWDLWKARQRASGGGLDRARAALAVRSHLARIERARPLGGIPQPEQRAAAERVRRWVKEDLLHGSPD